MTHKKQLTQAEDDARSFEFLWVDVETTGLDPHADRVLEIAAVLCEDDAHGDFEIVHAFSAVLSAAELGTAAALQNMDPYVRDMHTRNGLLEACAGPDAVTTKDADTFLMHVCDELLGARPRSIRLAGASVHFDLGFCRAQFPGFAAYLNHRIYDVSTMTAHVKAYVDPAWKGAPREQHRALPDILATIADAKAIRAMLAGGA